MQQVVESIGKLYESWAGKPASSIDVLPQSGSERRYFRIHAADGSTVLGTYGANIQENETFLYFSNHLYKKHLPVPEIYAVSEDRIFYLQLHDWISKVIQMKCMNYSN
jgi:hypothetical protein